MAGRRTDLALEAKEIWEEGAAEAAVAEGNRSEADVAYKVAVKAVDKAVVKGLLHKNNAAHKKSSMTIKLSKLA